MPLLRGSGGGRGKQAVFLQSSGVSRTLRGQQCLWMSPPVLKQQSLGLGRGLSVGVLCLRFGRIYLWAGAVLRIIYHHLTHASARLLRTQLCLQLGHISPVATTNLCEQHPWKSGVVVIAGGLTVPLQASGAEC